MYDEIVKEVSLSADEVDLIIDLLTSYQDRCLPVGEEIIVQELLHKLES